RKTMIPTAVSQIIEQIFNAAVSIFAAWLFIRLSNTANRAGMGAAGGTMGTLAGAVTGLAFLIFVFIAYMPRMRGHLSHDCGAHTDTASEIGKMLAVTILPIILSQAVYQASGIIDGTLFGRLYTGGDKKILVSIYSKYRTLINVPNAISSAMASSMIPTLVSLRAVGNHKAFKAKLAVAVKVNMVIAFPCAVGLTVLGTPIMQVLFPSTDYVISGRMLLFGSIAVVFYALSTITNAALQGLDKMNRPVIHAAVSLAIHIILAALLLKFTKLGIYALLIGAVTFPLVVCILNWISVGRFGNYRQEIKTTFLIPAAASVVMGALTWLVRLLTSRLFGGSYTANFISVVICIIFAVAVYFVMIFLFKGLTERDMPDFPMGLRLAKIARRLRLLR
ncbi:MAG: polysaccharide biosynthesis C-terminal domain-containing protein, partial [Butyrivibrio sp.]|nr:polysaccharide biosynthesis C-terminal domain-containing protein [Butyrivibrio sp.]